MNFTLTDNSMSFALILRAQGFTTHTLDQSFISPDVLPSCRLDFPMGRIVNDIKEPISRVLRAPVGVHSMPDPPAL